MSLFDFIRTCCLWFLAYLIIKGVFISLGLGKSKKRMILSKLKKLSAEASKAQRFFGNAFNLSVGKAYRKLGKVKRRCLKAEKRFRIYLFDNPDNKTMEAIRNAFLSEKKECSKRIANALSNDSLVRLGQEETTLMSDCMGDFSKACDEAAEKVIVEIKRGKQRDSSGL